MMRYFEFRRGELKDNSHSYLIEVQQNMNLKDPSGFGESQKIQARNGLLEVSFSSPSPRCFVIDIALPRFLSFHN